MPLYMSNAVHSAISDAAKGKITADITRVHCDITDAPSAFVHAFFMDDAAHMPLDDIEGAIRNTPAALVTVGGDIMPEPGEEAEWVAAHGARKAAEND
ncbi:MAG: hypothetical protein AAGM33_06640 [Pseudomonadota bacterium]